MSQNSDTQRVIHILPTGCDAETAKMLPVRGMQSSRKPSAVVSVEQVIAELDEDMCDNPTKWSWLSIGPRGRQRWLDEGKRVPRALQNKNVVISVPFDRIVGDTRALLVDSRAVTLLPVGPGEPFPR